MNISVVKKKDIKVLVRLNEYVHNLHYEKHPSIFRQYNYDEMITDLGEYFNQEFNKSFICYHKDKPIGYAVVAVRSYPPCLFQENHSALFIDQMCVIPGYRGKGIGKKMMEHLKQFAKQENLSRIELSVWSVNDEAKSFYKKIGFETYSERMKLDF